MNICTVQISMLNQELLAQGGPNKECSGSQVGKNKFRLQLVSTEQEFSGFLSPASTSLERKDLLPKDLSRGDWPADVDPLSLLPLCLSP